MNNSKSKFLYVLNSANCFYNTYRLLETKIQYNCDQSPYIIPSIVNSVFAIELYLKAILVYNNISYNKGHYLNYLFQLLPLEIQNSINEEYQNKIKKKKGLCLYNTLNEYLKGEYNSFEMWRYPFDDWKNYRCVFPCNETQTLLEILKKQCECYKNELLRR